MVIGTIAAIDQRPLARLGRSSKRNFGQM